MQNQVFCSPTPKVWALSGMFPYMCECGENEGLQYLTLNPYITLRKEKEKNWTQGGEKMGWRPLPHIWACCPPGKQAHMWGNKLVFSPMPPTSIIRSKPKYRGNKPIF